MMALAVGLLVPLMMAAAVLGSLWALRSPAGSAWLLTQLPGLQIEAPEGSLLGEFSARRLVYALPGEGRLTISGLRWQGLGIAWSNSPRLWGQLQIARLQADRVDLLLPPSQEKSPPPTDLLLPLGIRVSVLEVGEFSMAALGERPLRGLKGSLDLSAEEGSVHRVRLDALQWERLRLAGTASAQTGGAMAIAATLNVQPLAAEEKTEARQLPDWRGSLGLAGPLRKLQARAELQAAGQRLQAEATLQPFEAWPLAALQAHAEQLDLSALLADMPRTALSGEARLESKGWAEPARLRLQFSNAAAGRWDQQRLPLQHIRLQIEGRPDQPESLRLSELEALLGAPGAPGGRIGGQGRLQAGKDAGKGSDSGWSLTTQLSGLRPAALDARLAPLRLDGRLQLSGAADVGSAPLQIAADLAGDWPGGTTGPVQIALQASLQGRALEIRQARLESGRSRLQLAGTASQPEGGGWRAEARLALQDFDPRLLWAGAPGSAWQRSASGLNAEGLLKLQQDARAQGWPLGQVQLRLAPSKLAGVALGGKLDYAHDGGRDALLQAQLELAENRLLLLSRLPGTLAAPTLDTQIELAAPKLAGLTPLLALLQPNAQLSGAAEGKLGLLLRRAEAQRRQGPAPWQLSGDGQLSLSNLRIDGPLRAGIAQGRLRWAAGGRLDSPLLLNAELDRATLAGQLINKLSLDLQGSWAEHRLALSLQGLMNPPTAGQRSGAAAPSVSGEGRLTLSGALSGAPLQAWQDGNPLSWKAQIAQLLLRPSEAARPDWLKAAGLELQLQTDAGLAPASAALAPGGLELAGARLRWSELRWQAPRARGEPADVRAEIELQPLALAPLLARWQPDFGWGGELVIGGRASLRSLPQLQLNAVLERAGGDLSVTDERGVQALGLSDLRIGLTVIDGQWQFTQALAGSHMGSLGGAVTVHAERRALWPAPNARLEGVLQANVANLGTWGGWVPPGWRLGGALSAGVRLAGSFGAPQVVGEASGRGIALRNPLLGVDVSDGAFALSFDGPTATLASLSARAGAGTINASGEARLGAQPSARLELKADHFALLNRVDRRLLASGQAQLQLGAQELKLDGRFLIDEGLFDFSRSNAPSLGDDVYVMRPEQQLPAELAKPAAGQRERKTRVNLELDLGRELKLRGRGLDSRLRGELKLSQLDGPPRLTGTVRTVGGSYNAYGQKLDIERGELTFTGAYDNPRLDVEAVRPNADVRVGVKVTGTAENPRVKLFSEPEMNDTDKLSWLVLGRGSEGLDGQDTALLQTAALALLSGEGEGATDKVIKGLGLDELSVSPGGDDDTRGTVVRLGKQLSRRWYVGYERGLNATTGSWQLIYRIAQRFTVRAQSGEENGIDLIWQWKWD
ncbi:translocation/assembly module TamB domain-containing protein [Roseateles violae]|uniref:Translocation/assembly module TamB domain-containing protein n=1 Tax=Roseateles violae TaxID=3058042 RepID=A0ABT8DUU6_9BURK|nr:translocation/assembly module TamB domain-containing protein [Pelomonas sp. PFR6]MDN3920805.1 translocation/assembly module TamB domain-containing protein [Pelomonas sp. PFR6]